MYEITGLGIKGNKGTSTANQEVLPVIDAQWSIPKGQYYEFSFLNTQACTLIVNGKDTVYLDADQGFEINKGDATIKSLVIVEANISYKWFGKYGN